jgi:hypothetical protein
MSEQSPTLTIILALLFVVIMIGAIGANIVQKRRANRAE